MMAQMLALALTPALERRLPPLFPAQAQALGLAPMTLLERVPFRRSQVLPPALQPRSLRWNGEYCPKSRRNVSLASNSQG